jgi:uncharacterized protein YprB with RNaseH-like and TPR domain
MLERLRHLQSLRTQSSRAPGLPDERAAGATADAPGRRELVRVPLDDEGNERPVYLRRGRMALEQAAPGEVVETALGECYVVTTRFPLTLRRGPQPLGQLLAHSPADLAAFHPDFGLAAHSNYAQALFLDTETTGLGGGASTYAFMVGAGYFEGNSFLVQQLFMRHPGEEGPLLLYLAQLLEERGPLVTFNGRSFDVPLLKGRYLQHRRFLPQESGRALAQLNNGAHLDLLYPARRLWKRRLQSCRLLNLEQQILGLSRNGDDVPGSLIPQMYVDYVRSGNAAEMQRVFYHNLEDIVTMPALAQQIAQSFGEPFAGTERLPVQGADWLGLGAWYAEQGNEPLAEQALRMALEHDRAPDVQAEGYHRLGQLYKRRARWDEAAEAWQRWLGSVPGFYLEPFEELATYCEWVTHDLEQAEMWAGFALATLHGTPPHQRPPGAAHQLEHRLERIRRKQRRPASGAPDQGESGQGESGHGEPG